MEAWLLRLQQWIKRLFKGKKKRRTPTTNIIKSWSNAHCIIHQIERDAPDAIATYRINRSGKYDYLITLDRLKKRRSTDTFVQTHRLGILRIWRDNSIHCINGWDIDLEGLSASGGIKERAPRQALMYVVKSVLEISLNWKFGIEDIDWLFLLRNRIREELSNPNHNLNSILVFP